MATMAAQQPRVIRSQEARNRKIGFYAALIAVNIILLIMVALTVTPFLYMIFSAFKPNAEIFGTPLTFWPVHPTFVNMQTLIANFPFIRWTMNTAVVAICSTLGSVLLSSLAGYAFAKYEFRFKRALFVLMLVTVLIPGQVLLVPQFQIIRFLHWFDTFAALIIPGLVGAFGIILMRQYTLSVPNELLDAARVDGASEFGIWWRIVLPLVRPGLAVLAILAFTGSWNSFLWPLIVTTTTNMFVINLGIASLVGPYDYQYGILLSGAVLSSVPIIIMFFIFQRQFIEGLTQGGVKF